MATKPIEMKILKYIIVAVIVVALALVIVGYLSPEKVEVEHTQVIDEPIGKVYDNIANLNTWGDWDPWSQQDPEMEVEIAGPLMEEGMRRSWKSEKVGSGSMRLIQAVPLNILSFSIHFLDQGTALSVFNLKEVEGGTEVTWSIEFEVGSNPFMRLMGLMMKGAIKSDYEEGLNNLSEYLKDKPNPYPGKEFSVEEVNIPYEKMYAMRNRYVSPEDFTKLVFANIEQLELTAKKRNAQVIGGPFVRWNYSTPASDTLNFDVMTPVFDTTNSITQGLNVLAYDTTAKMIRHTYAGGPYGVSLSIDSMRKAALANNISILGSPLTFLRNGSYDADTSEWVTDIYFPLEEL